MSSSSLDISLEIREMRGAWSGFKIIFRTGNKIKLTLHYLFATFIRNTGPGT